MTFEQLAKANAEMIRTDIKGKAYAEVPQRIQAFRKCYPEGTIETEIISLENGVVTMKATVKNIDIVLGTGHAQEKESGSFINKTSFIENCETSAVGRALGMCGFGSEQSIASAEEVVNAINNQNAAKKAKISKAQLKILRETEIEHGISENYLKECFKCRLEDITEDDYQKIMRNLPLIVEKSEAYEKNKAAQL